MNQDRRSILMVAGILAVLAAGLAGLAWPKYRALSAIRAEISDIESKLVTLPTRQSYSEELTQLVNDVHLEVQRDLRAIPTNPDVADLMRSLSTPIDGERVLDQTFTAGRAVPIEGIKEDNLWMLPVTVEMKTEFAVVQELLSQVESLSRLVRIGSVRMEVTDESHRYVLAIVGLEVVYAPPAAKQEGR